MATIWDLFYSLLDTHIKNKEYDKAKTLISMGVKRANRQYCDPRLILKQLKYYKTLVEQLEAEVSLEKSI